jgi:hypothetical protein
MTSGLTRGLPSAVLIRGACAVGSLSTRRARVFPALRGGSGRISFLALTTAGAVALRASARIILNLINLINLIESKAHARAALLMRRLRP